MYIYNGFQELDELLQNNHLSMMKFPDSAPGPRHETVPNHVGSLITKHGQ